jgi:predicted aspartyl protease
MEKDTLRPPFHPLAALAFWLWLAVLPGVAEPPTVRAAPATASAGVAPASSLPTSVPPVGRNQQGYILPFTPVPDHGGPLVKVRINGKFDATFLIDTGSTDCYVSQALVSKIGLVTYSVTLPSSKGKSAHCVSFNSLGFQTEKADSPLIFQPLDAPIIVAPDELLRLSSNLTVGGIIGANFLQNFAVNFDFSAHQIILITPGGLSAAQTRQLGYTAGDEAVLPLTALGNYLYSLPVVLERGAVSQRADLQVDTGSKVTTIPRDTAQALSLVSEGRQPLTGGTVGYRVQIRSTVSVLALGDIRLLDRSVLYPDKGDYPSLLGMDILMGYKILIDYPAHKVYLTPNLPLAPVQIKPTAPTAPAPAAPPATAATPVKPTPPAPK